LLKTFPSGQIVHGYYYYYYYIRLTAFSRTTWKHFNVWKHYFVHNLQLYCWTKRYCSAVSYALL